MVKSKRAPKKSGVTNLRRQKLTTLPSRDQPTVLWPVVSRVESRFELSEAGYSVLEGCGKISLTTEAHRILGDIAESWVAHDRVLNSPRPWDFKSRLTEIINALKAAREAVDINRCGASQMERHLINWLANLKIAGEAPYFEYSQSLESSMLLMLDFFEAAITALPMDTGAPRHKDEERYLILLADLFEAAGGRAVAYPSKHAAEGYADTPFRQFVHHYYNLLPLKSRRTRSGLDEALRRALRFRRRAWSG